MEFSAELLELDDVEVEDEIPETADDIGHSVL
jgi:hypothetical protein